MTIAPSASAIADSSLDTSENLTYTPVVGATFNNPRGTSVQQQAIKTIQLAAIKGVPKDDYIRIATYAFNEPDITAALVAAYKRGVHVQILIDDHGISDQIIQLQKLLGTDRTKDSVIFRCKQGCMSDAPASLMHAKFMTFTHVGKADHVIIVGSGNITTSNALIAWNSAYTMSGNIPIYNGFIQYFKDMLPDKTRTDYSQTVTSGKYSAFFYPSAATHDPSDYYLNALKGITCNDNAAGYGTPGGHTLIRIGMFSWTHVRDSVANRLWDLDNQGCVVQIVSSIYMYEPQTIKTLLKPGGKNGNPQIYNAQLDFNGDGKTDKYYHNKFIAISGRINNKSTKLVYEGTINMTGSPQRTDNDFILKIVDGKTFDQFSASIDMMSATHSIQQVKTVPTSASFQSFGLTQNQIEEE